MNWEFEVDGKRTTVRDVPELEGLLLTAETQSARILALERVKHKRVPRWENVVYRLLGLRSLDSEAHGTLEVYLSSNKAFVVFTRNDDDDGVIGTIEPVAQGQVEFTTSAGEKFLEAAPRCVPREAALSAMIAFMRSAKRPSNLKWQPIRKRRP